MPLVLVFALATTANADLSLYIDNSPAPNEVEILVDEILTIQIYSSDNSRWVGGYVILEEGGDGELNNPWQQTIVGPGYAGDLGYIREYDESGWGTGYEMQADFLTTPPQAGVQFTVDLDATGLAVDSNCVISFWLDPDYEIPVDLIVITVASARGDFEPDGDVDTYDFAILAIAWMSSPGDDNWNPDCDISEPSGNVIDYCDLSVLVEYWLAGL